MGKINKNKLAHDKCPSRQVLTVDFDCGVGYESRHMHRYHIHYVYISVGTCTKKMEKRKSGFVYSALCSEGL
jgi:hypothetical protein